MHGEPDLGAGVGVSNKRPRHLRSTHEYVNDESEIGPDTVIGKIAAHTGEPPRDVEAAIATLVSAGNDFDVVWEWMREAINDGKGIVEMATERLGSPN